MLQKLAEVLYIENSQPVYFLTHTECASRGGLHIHTTLFEVGLVGERHIIEVGFSNA